MTYLGRPGLPPGRITVRELCARARCSRATFCAKYRHDPDWQKRVDLRAMEDGTLHVSEAGGEALARARLGARPEGPTRRAENLGWRANKRPPPLQHPSEDEQPASPEHPGPADTTPNG